MVDAKSLIHAKRWKVYVNEKGNLFKGGSFVEAAIHDRKKFLWEVVYNHVVEDLTNHDETGLRGLDFICFGED